MGSEDVSALLAEAGVVKDANAYNEWLISNGYATRIQTGTFEIKIGASEEEIAKTICF